MQHPLIQLEATAFLRELDSLVDKKTVQKRKLSRADFVIYKYADASRVTGIARLARGLIVNAVTSAFVNLPMPKFDELAPFAPDMAEYHSNIEKYLPPTMSVQPKHDGTCIHAIQLENELLVTTFLADASPQIKVARAILERGNPWNRNTTLAFELVDASDPKVQTNRVTDGLYLFYGAHSDGTILSRDDLVAISEQIGTVSIVKEQTLSRSKVLGHLRRLDDTCEADHVQEGMVVHFKDGSRHKIKSWLYLQLSNATKPSNAWMRTVVRKASTLEDVHIAVESFTGPLDLPLQAHFKLQALLAECRVIIGKLQTLTCESVDEIKAQGRLAPLFFERRKNPHFVADSDESILKMMRIVLQ